jgi:uncharacterized cupin superfamily protein
MSQAFVVNVADSPAIRFAGSGTYVPFEDPADEFPDFGINIHMLDPGEANAKHHSESVQEAFLVLGGECMVILDGEKRHLKQWDFVHCPAGTEHVFVGTGDGPCWVLMVGARKPGRKVHFPKNEDAARFGASVQEPTDDAQEAYADWTAESELTKLPWPPR